MGRIAAALAATALLLAACGDDGDTTTATTTTTSPDEPALDRTGEEVLAEAGMIRDGEAWVGAVDPEDPAIHAALCDYVFGDADEAADIAGLAGEVELYEESGFQSEPGEGHGVACLFVVDGVVQALAVGLWSEEIPEFDDELGVVFNGPAGNDHHGFLAYGPDYTGPQVDQQTAADWLADASTRWGGASA